MAEAKVARIEIAIDCPTCHEGESVTYEHDRDRSRVWCDVCGTSGPWEEAGGGRDQLSNAAKSWNDLFAEPASEGHNADEREDDETSQVPGS